MDEKNIADLVDYHEEYVDSFSHFLEYLKLKYGENWKDSMLNPSEYGIIMGFRNMSLHDEVGKYD